MASQIAVRKEIAARLRQARKDAGYTTAESFCESCHVPFKDYLGHEEGKTIMRASQAMNYCNLLHVSLNWLMIGDDLRKS